MRINLWLGKYRILSILHSSGTQSSVFLAEHIRLQEECVIKKIRKDHPFYPKIKNEVYFLTKLKGKFLPKIYDVEEDEENLYLIEEYIRGMPLIEASWKHRGLSEKLLFEITEELINFLCYLHERDEPVLYLDWKPEHFIFSEEGLKVIDFGSAVEEKPKSGELLLATSDFAAPEIRIGKEIDTSADLFGLGSLVLYLLPFTVSDKSLFWGRSIKKKIEKIFQYCVLPNPSRRWGLLKLKKEVNRIKKSPFSAERKKEPLLYIQKNERMIGVGGAERGIGTTHFAILLAVSLAKKGRKVIFLSFSKEEEGFYKRIKIAFPILSEVAKGNKENMILALNGGFQHIVVDFGLMREEIGEEFLRCDKKLVVVQDSVLKLNMQLYILNRNRLYLIGENTDFVVNMGGKEQVRKMRKELERLHLHCPVFSQPYERIEERG